MSLLLKPSELKGSTTFKGLIYGQPGIGKSTLALSAPNPVCFDFDKGMKRVEAQYRVSSLQVDTYQQVIDVLNSGEADNFDTLVIDTLGKLVDRICDHVAKANPKIRQSDGQMSVKGWGAVKSCFQSFFKLLEATNKSILFVAHESEERNGEETIKRPDCSGSARKDIIKELDFMGYMEMSEGKRVVTFSPSDKFYAKNSLGLYGKIEVTDTKNGNNFVSKEIVKMSQARLAEQAELRTLYEDLITMINSNIDGLTSEEEVNAYYQEMGKKKVIWGSALYEKQRLAEKVKELGVVFDKEEKSFKKAA